MSGETLHTRESLSNLSKEQLIDIILNQSAVQTPRLPLKRKHEESENADNSSPTTKMDSLNKPQLKKSKNDGSQKKLDWSKYSKRHVAFKIAYLGWNYHGFVSQQGTEETVEVHIAIC
jgi:tRNA pseudouridine38/39 synthase